MFDDRVGKAFELAHLLCISADLHLYVTIMIADKNGTVVSFKSGWAGGPTEKSNKSMYYSLIKAVELLQNNRDPIGVTPVENFPSSLNMKGGVRERIDTYDYIVACENFGEWCNLLFASLLLYSMTHPVALHHMGFHYRNLDDMQKAVEKNCREVGSECIEIPVTIGNQIFIPIPTSENNQKIYWKVHEFHPRQQRLSIFWDLVTPNSLEMLGFISNFLQLDYDSFDVKAENEPDGFIQEQNDDNLIFEIRIRQKWWDIKK